MSACVISRHVHRFLPSTGGTSVGAFEHEGFSSLICAEFCAFSPPASAGVFHLREEKPENKAPDGTTRFPE